MLARKIVKKRKRTGQEALVERVSIAVGKIARKNKYLVMYVDKKKETFA